jgi:hypothetical protein
VRPRLAGGDDGHLLGPVERRASTRLSTSVGSTASWAAIFTGRSNRSTQSASSRDTPDRPASRASQVDAASRRAGSSRRSPVTTTSVRTHWVSESHWFFAM